MVFFNRFVFLFGFFCWINHLSFSQTSDTLPDISKQEITYLSGMDESSLRVSIDTTLHSLHYFDPADAGNFLYRNTGNLGSAHFLIVCCPEQQTGLQTGYEQYSLYRFTKDKIRFYRNVRPYTHLTMLIGQRKEQAFGVTHSQNIRKKFNFGFHFMRMAGEGAYVRQQTRHNDIAFTTLFDSKKRYRLKTLLIFNSLRVEENGGVKNIGIFEDTSFVSKQLVAVELQQAENKRRDIYFHARQSWNLGSFSTSRDTTTADLPVCSNPKWHVYHEIEAGREQYEYNDAQPDSAYYGLFYFDDSVDNDYISKSDKLNFGSTLGVKKFISRNHVLAISSAYSFGIIGQDGFPDSRLQNLEAGISFYKDTSLRISYGASAIYSFLDYNKDDLKASAFFTYNFGDAGKIQAEVAYARIQPAWLYHRFSFGEISWLNDFHKQAGISASLAYHLSKYHFHLSAQLHQIDGLAFWDERRLPAQTQASQQVWVVELRKLFRIRYFGLDNFIRVQLVSDKNFLRYPIYWGVHSLFYERGIFKSKLLTKIGADIRYNSNYKAYGYFPLTGQFHLQDAETLKFYPAMDVYLSFRIQTVRLFLIMNHVNQGMFGNKGYFSAYKYPADDRHFRFGVSWMFLD
ncbi:MAG TPA: putative porin [Chitinophagales bacterium]|nr:putative porin [Chitinophagales bacterium]